MIYQTKNLQVLNNPAITTIEQVIHRENNKRGKRNSKTITKTVNILEQNL
jgi:hypothetical protein